MYDYIVILIEDKEYNYILHLSLLVFVYFCFNFEH